MDITTDFLDIEEYEAKRLAPATLVRRDGHTWLTRDVPLLVEHDTEWGICQEGDVVRIPLFPYITRGQDPSIAIGFAFELGFRARAFVDPQYEVARLHISVGCPVYEYHMPDGNTSLKFWLGFGFVVRKK